MRAGRPHGDGRGAQARAQPRRAGLHHAAQGRRPRAGGPGERDRAARRRDQRRAPRRRWRLARRHVRRPGFRAGLAAPGPGTGRSPRRAPWRGRRRARDRVCAGGSGSGVDLGPRARARKGGRARRRSPERLSCGFAARRPAAGRRVRPARARDADRDEARRSAPVAGRRALRGGSRRRLHDQARSHAVPRSRARARVRDGPRAGHGGRAARRAVQVLRLRRGPVDVNPPDPELLSINTATLWESCNLRQAIDALRRHNIRGIAPWRDRVAEAGVKEAARMIRDNGLTVTGLVRGGFFPAAERKQRQAAIDDNRRAIDDAATIGAKCLVIVAGGLPKESKDLGGAREMVRDGLGKLLDHARENGVPLAIEPMHPMYCADRGCVNTLAHALDLCDELAGKSSGEMGVAVDVYHVWWDPDLKRQIERAGEKRLLAFHLCDWLVPTTDLLYDRGMMGDGVIDIPLIRSWLETVGYHGMQEVEIFSKNNWWKRAPDEVLGMCRVRHQTVC